MMTIINDGHNYRTQLLSLRCDIHNTLMTENYVYKHLRQCNNTAAGGKSKLHNRVNLSPISIHMTPSVVREIIFRILRRSFYMMMQKFNHSLGIFKVDKPVLMSQKVDLGDMNNLHELVAQLADFNIFAHVEKLPYGRSLFNIGDNDATANDPANPLEGATENDPANSLDSATANYPASLFEGASAAANRISGGSEVSCTARLTPDDELTDLVLDGIQYNVEGFLGAGNFSKCYTVVAKADFEKKAACKITLKSPDTLHLCEIEMHKKCSKNDNIVQFIAAYENEQFSAIVMELCLSGSNTTLSDLIWDEYFVDFDDWIDFMRQIINGVQYIHRNNVIHRDLKACNIMLQSNILKIGDFGLAIDESAPAKELQAFCGTIPYIAPEIINREGAKLKSDIWAVAVIAYLLYKGERPFDRSGECEDHANRVYKRILHAEFEFKVDRDDAPFIELINLVFQTKWQRRPSATELLQLRFFHNPNAVRKMKMPRKNDKITVVPMHVVSANKIYVHIFGQNYDIFETMQFEKLQRIEAKPLENPGKNIFIIFAICVTYILEIFLYYFIQDLNQLVLAKYSDGKIYRARFLDMKQGKYKVLIFPLYSSKPNFYNKIQYHQRFSTWTTATSTG